MPHPSPPWYRRLIVGIEIGPTGANDGDDVYMARATGREFVANLLGARAQYAVIFMKDHDFAYYPSRVARPCPNLGGRDLLRECLDEATPHDLTLIAYCQVQYDTSSWRAHPEWRMRDSDGRDIPGRLCYRSGYLGFVQACAAEMMEYEIAGFHFDMLDFGFAPPESAPAAPGLTRRSGGEHMDSQHLRTGVKSLIEAHPEVGEIQC